MQETVEWGTWTTASEKAAPSFQHCAVQHNIPKGNLVIHPMCVTVKGRIAPYDYWQDPNIEETTMARTAAQATRPVTHFGETLRASKYSHRLIRDEYALPNKKTSTWSPPETYTEEEWAAHGWMYEDEGHRIHSDEFCSRQREAALENFDLNMIFFRQLSGKGLLEALTGMLGKHKNLRPVTDLAAFDSVEGAYVMVLDRYKQAYIGQAWDIRTRIKRHQSGTKQFDRLIFPDKETSVLSIDSFRALDTTRIFAAKTTGGMELEQRLISTFPPDFLLNRVPGGDRIMGARFLPWEIKQRRLVPPNNRTASGIAPLIPSWGTLFCGGHPSQHGPGGPTGPHFMITGFRGRYLLD